MNKFIEDMPNEDYHSSLGVSKSGLDLIARSPAHYKYPKPRIATRGMEMGTAIHTASLEPDRFDSEYVIVDCSARNLKAYKDQKAITGGELTLTADEGKKVMGMRESVENDHQAMSIITQPGRNELSAMAQDPETGVIIRARFDLLTDSGIALDLKKTQDVRPHKFMRSVSDYRYHVQDAMYSFVYELITGEPLKEFWFLAVEEESPHSCHMYQLSDLAKEMGAYYFRRDLRTYAECVKSGKWGHPDIEDNILDLPNWTVSQYENDLEVML